MSERFLLKALYAAMGLLLLLDLFLCIFSEYVITKLYPVFYAGLSWA
jgi:hypothetical protein